MYKGNVPIKTKLFWPRSIIMHVFLFIFLMHMYHMSLQYCCKYCIIIQQVEQVIFTSICCPQLAPPHCSHNLDSGHNVHSRFIRKTYIEFITSKFIQFIIAAVLIILHCIRLTGTLLVQHSIYGEQDIIHGSTSILSTQFTAYTLLQHG